MDFLEIKKILEDNYSLRVEQIEKVKSTYKIKCIEGTFAIKVIKYEYSHFYFIISVINHLQRRGFGEIPKIINNKNNQMFIKLDNKYAYLTEWIDSRTSNYDNIDELKMVSEKLAELHKCSEGFILSKEMKPRIGWYSWIKVFETRCDEILDFKKRISQKAYNSEFDNIYMSFINKELERGRRAIGELKDSKYIEVMNKEVMKRGVCHHDFAHHNVLIDKKNQLNIIDFDYCILDSHIHDLSSLIIRTMKGGKWSKDKANIILNSYAKKNSIYDNELKLIKAFIRFPQGFWQIGLQYYWEQQPWGEEFMIKKIRKYLDDIDNREEFVETFFET